MSCEGSIQKNSDKILIESISDRKQSLNENFRYRVNEYTGKYPSITQIEDALKNLNDQKSKDLILSLFDDLNLDLSLGDFEDDSFSKQLLELRLFTELEIHFASNLSFNEVRPMVYEVDETTNDIEYRIVLNAFDSLFNPAFELIQAGDTFDIAVNDLGEGYITFQKRDKYIKPSFSGDAIFYDKNGSVIRVPFSSSRN